MVPQEQLPKRTPRRGLFSIRCEDSLAESTVKYDLDGIASAWRPNAPHGHQLHALAEGDSMHLLNRNVKSGS